MAFFALFAWRNDDAAAGERLMRRAAAALDLTVAVFVVEVRRCDAWVSDAVAFLNGGSPKLLSSLLLLLLLSQTMPPSLLLLSLERVMEGMAVLVVSQSVTLLN